MEELMKQLYGQHTDKKLSHSDYQDMVTTYGDNMEQFTRDFEKKYITPKGQAFDKGVYLSLIHI